jgi:hypothetical protein
MRRHMAWSRSMAPASGATSPGSTGSGLSLEIAQTYVVPSARGKILGDCTPPCASGNSRKCFGGHPRPGIEDEAVTFEAEHRRERQPLCSQYRPGPHGDDHRIAFDGGSIDGNAADARAVLERNACDSSWTQLRALRHRCSHQGTREVTGVNLSGGLGRPKDPVHQHPIGEPIDVVRGARWPNMASFCGRAAVGRHAPIAPITPDLVCEAPMQGEAAPSQRLERRAIAPVERQESARLAGGRASERSAFDDRCLDIAATEEIGDRGANDAAATDKNPHLPLQASKQPDSKSQPLPRVSLARSSCHPNG